MGQVILITPRFDKIFSGHIRIVPKNLSVKFEVVALTVLKLLTFNLHKCTDHVTVARPFCKKW